MNPTIPAFLNIVKIEILNTENGLWKKICDTLKDKMCSSNSICAYIYNFQNLQFSKW